MSLSVATYLYCTRQKRKFPQFVKLQIALILFEYSLATALQAYVVHHSKQNNFGRDGNIQGETLFVKIFYPFNEVLNLGFLYYNWTYVLQYLKAAFILPVVLAGPLLERQGQDVVELLRQATSKYVCINWVWKG